MYVSYVWISTAPLISWLVFLTCIPSFWGFLVSVWVLFLVTIITLKLWQVLYFLQERFYFCLWQAVRVEVNLHLIWIEVIWWSFSFWGLVRVSFISDAWSISSWSLLLECSPLRVPAECIKCLWGLFSIGRCLLSLFLQPHETIKMPLRHYYKICKYPGR